MNIFEKNKNNTTKQKAMPDIANDQLGENASNECKSEDYKNVKNINYKTK